MTMANMAAHESGLGNSPKNPVPKPSLATRPAPRAAGDGVAASESALSAAVEFAYLFLRRQWPIILMGLVLGLCLMPLALVISPPSYQAVATLMLDTSKIEVLPQQGLVGDTPMDNSAAIESQLEILRSERIAWHVIDKLGLTSAPEFAMPQAGRIERWFGPKVAELLGQKPDASPGRLKTLQLDTFNKLVEVRRISGTFAVDVFARSNSAAQAAAIANAVVDAYLEEQLDAKQRVSRRATDWLGTRLTDMRSRLESAQKAVIDFRAMQGLSGASGKEATERHLTELNSQLGTARGQARDAQVRLERAERAIEDYKKSDVKPVIPDLMSNPTVTKLREQFLELRAREADWSIRFGKTHMATVKLRERMMDIDANLLAEYERLSESYRSELAMATSRVAAIEEAIANASSKQEVEEHAQIHLSELEAAVRSYQQIYDSFLSRNLQAKEQEEFPIPRAWVVNQASEPLAKNPKKTMQFAAILFMLGLGIGGAIATLRDFSDGTFRRLSDVRAIFGSVPAEIVPFVTTGELGGDGRVNPAPAVAPGERKLVRTSHLIWLVERKRHSAYARAIRSTRLRLDRRFRKMSNAVVGLTSAEPSEGASTTAASLAITAAASGCKVLLIDGDIRHPALSEILAPNAQVGLGEVVTGQVTLEDAVWTDEQSGLHFLPVHNRNRAFAEDLIALAEMRKLLETAKEHYRYIIVDLPPLAPMSDVELTTDCFDGYVSLIRWGQSSKDMASLCYQRAGIPVDKLAAVLLNFVDTNRLRLYDRAASRWFDQRLYHNYMAVDS